MAPEVFFEKPYDHSADIWSIGTIFYELLTGFTVFNSKKRYQHLNNVESGIYYIPKTIGLSEKGLDFIWSCLRYNPKERLNW